MEINKINKINKIKHINTTAAELVGGRIILSRKEFKEIIDAINLQTDTINKLIDTLESVNALTEDNKTEIQMLAKAIQQL